MEKLRHGIVLQQQTLKNISVQLNRLYLDPGWKQYCNSKKINPLMQNGEKFVDVINKNLNQFKGCDQVFISRDVSIITWQKNSEFNINKNQKYWIGVLHGDLKIKNDNFDTQRIVSDQIIENSKLKIVNDNDIAVAILINDPSSKKTTMYEDFLEISTTGILLGVTVFQLCHIIFR